MSSSTALASPPYRSPTARRSGTCLPSSARPSRSFRSTHATLRYLELTGRPTEQIELVEAYAQEQGLWHDESSREPVFTDTLELDLGEVESSLAGPRRPQDRIALSAARRSLHETLESYLDDAVAGSFPASDPPANGTNGAHTTAARVKLADGEVVELDHGDVVIAAITSCTNTSNPSVMLGAGLLAATPSRVDCGASPG